MSLGKHITLLVHSFAVEKIFYLSFAIFEIKEMAGVKPWSWKNVIWGVFFWTTFVHCWLSNVHVALVELSTLAVPTSLATGAKASVVCVDCWILTLHYLLVVVVCFDEVVAFSSVSQSLWLLILGPASVIDLLNLNFLGLLRAISVIQKPSEPIIFRFRLI